ncbi:Variant-specific surface protein, partial [Giardia duodenalis]
VNDPAGVSIDSLCRPASSPQTVTVGCTGSDGAALTDSSTACEMCSGGFFLFMGGCYKAGQAPGSEICTAAEGGRCTACNTKDNYIFQNRAAVVTLGNECILCSDITSRDGVMGVANCNKCTAPGSAGPAVCNTCQEGYYKDSNAACTQCNSACATCSGADATSCETCKAGYYLKSDHSCIEESQCTGANYPDKQSGECKACSEITDCTACAYNDATGKPKCTACNGSKKVKTALDDTTTCITVASECADDYHFKADDGSACYLCGDTSGTDPNKGVVQCKACTKTASQKPACTDCLEGYIKEGDNAVATCQACGTGCATCSEAGNANKCSTCMAGFFLVETADNGQCVSCGDTAQGGIDGCAECSGTAGSLKCIKCSPNRRSKGEPGNYTCEEKTCEDDSACGGTAGACDAIVINGSGEMTYYCSLCGASDKVPIDGKCVDKTSSANGNTCAKGVCTSCTTGYFLYVGGGLLQHHQYPWQPHVHRRYEWHMHNTNRSVLQGTRCNSRSAVRAGVREPGRHGGGRAGVRRGRGLQDVHGSIRGAQRCDGPGEVHGLRRRQEAQPARQRVLHV